jgi:FkbM family methyltransferase
MRAGTALRVASVLRRYPYRGKVAVWQRLARWLPPGDQTITLSTGGRMRVRPSLYWQRLMMAEAFERRAAWLVAGLLRPGDAFLDGGANCGFYACLAAGRVGPTGCVIAVEPDTRLHDQLAEQARLNAPQLTVRHAALTDVAGHATFHVPPDDIPDGWGLGIASLEPHPEWPTRQVEATTIDHITQNLDRPFTLAKLDLEGHEAQALRGARHALETGRLESLLVEVNDARLFDELRACTFTTILDVRHGFVDITDTATLDGSHTDIAFLRGQAAERWQHLRRRARWM